jgi:hypothetical protein
LFPAWSYSLYLPASASLVMVRATMPGFSGIILFDTYLEIIYASVHPTVADFKALAIVYLY